VKSPDAIQDDSYSLGGHSGMEIVININKNVVKIDPTYLGGQGSSPSPGEKYFNKVIRNGVKMERKICLG
jgi:hypothetical protein